VTLRRTAFALLFVTVAYNVLEGVLALAAGISAGSLSLIAFGFDSYIEVAAASAVIWRLSITDEEAGERAEQRAGRFIGATFLLMSVGITYQAATGLVQGNGADGSLLGIVLAAASVTFMPALALAKLRTAAKANMVILAAEAKETLACSYLSLTLLVGLVANAIAGWSWIDPVTALLLVPWLIKEGMEGIKGDVCFEGLRACFCRSCLYGVRTCPAACCAA
jgi:divalent metal cation (Fe/Co/Zn/Cd) transporter